MKGYERRGNIMKMSGILKIASLILGGTGLIISSLLDGEIQKETKDDVVREVLDQLSKQD